MLAAVRGDAGAQVLRGGGLAQAGDVVQFAFDAEQRGVADRRRLHALAADHPFPARQQEFLEHQPDRVQVVGRRHVQHRVVFVVEAAVRLGVLQVALDQVGVEIPVRHEVPAGVHRQEPSVLQEARIHRAAMPRIRLRHGVDDVVLEPRQRIARGQVVDLGRAAARVDRSAHHHQRARRGFAASGHQRYRGQHRHGRLAYADHVQLVGADVADEVLHIVDVVVQAEVAVALRHHARVDPVGDVDLVVAQQGAHGIAQQRGVVPGQRRHHQYGRLLLEPGHDLGVVAETLEAQQAAERLAQHFLFDDRQRVAVDLDVVQRPGRLLVVLAEPVQQFVAGGQTLGARERGPQAIGVGEDLGVGRCLVDPGGEQVAGQFVPLVEHAGVSILSVCCRAAYPIRGGCTLMGHQTNRFQCSRIPRQRWR